MGLIGLLVTAVIIILFLIFSNSSFLPSDTSSKTYETMQDRAQDAVNSTIEKSELKQKIIKDLGIP